MPADDTAAVAAAVCGFLNSRGGIVFVGLDPAGDVVGVGADVEEHRRNLATSLETAIAPTALFTASVDTEDGLSVISIEVPEGRDVPYVIAGQVFVRRGKRTIAADPEAIRDIVQGRSVEADRWERRPSVALSEDELVRSDIAEMAASATEFGRGSHSTMSKVTICGACFATWRLPHRTASPMPATCCSPKRPASQHPQARVRFLTIRKR